jgi:hypothetical protein
VRADTLQFLERAIGGILDGEKGAQMMWDDTSKRYWILEVHPDLLR